MRRLALLLALALAAPAAAQDLPVDDPLDAFTDHLADALDLKSVEAWEERLEADAERAWLAGREPEPEVDDMDAPRGAPTLGLTVCADPGDLVITRLVAPDAARARALAGRLVDGFAAPLGAGPVGRPIPRLPALVEVRGRHLLLVRGPAALDLPRALAARRAAWDAAGLPTPPAASDGLAVVSDDLLAVACTADGALGARLTDLAVTAAAPAGGVVARVARGEEGPGAGYRASAARAEEARALALGLANALGWSLDLPPGPSGD